MGGPCLSQKTLHLNKTNQYTVLEGVSEGSVQWKISDFTNTTLNRKRPHSLEKISTAGAKKPNKDSNSNLTPLGSHPTEANSTPSSLIGNHSEAVNAKANSPISVGGVEPVINSWRHI